jgi:hypothetical protein
MNQRLPSLERPLADEAARDRIAHDLNTTFVWKQRRGDRQDTALVGRMVAALMAGHARLDGVVAVTFTDLAPAS